MRTRRRPRQVLRAIGAADQCRRRRRHRHARRPVLGPARRISSAARWSTPVANNADFVANAIEVLGGGEELVGLRSRGTSVRPFEVVEEIQRAADDRYAAEQQALERKLKQTQAKLRELSAGEPADTKAALAPEQARADRAVPRRGGGDPPRIARRAGGVAAGHRAAEADPRIRRYRAGADHRRGGGAGARRAAAAALAPPPAGRGVRNRRCGNRPSCCCSSPRSRLSRPRPTPCSTGERAAPATAQGQRALPDLAARLGDLAWMRLAQGANKTDFTAIGGRWVLIEKGNYPANAGKVRRLLLGLADLTLVEPKTAPARAVVAARPRRPEQRQVDAGPVAGPHRRHGGRADRRQDPPRPARAAAPTASMSASPATTRPGWRAARSTCRPISRAGSTAASSTCRRRASRAVTLDRQRRRRIEAAPRRAGRPVRRRRPARRRAGQRRMPRWPSRPRRWPGSNSTTW